MPATGLYQWASSLPNFSYGRCPPCQSAVTLNFNALFSDDDIVSCGQCGANTPRRALILEALSVIDTLTWSLFSSNMYIWDQVNVSPGDYVSYDLRGLIVAKWQHHEARPNASSGQRYVAEVYFAESLAFLYVTDTQPSTPQGDETVPEVEATWYRFGLQQAGAVPAWRQSLFGAATLVTTHPAAAVVLVAAGFESFFLETMRIAWRERLLDQAGFERLNRRNLPISSLVEWLPPAVNRPSLLDAPGDLYQRWRTLVNERRNDVVHRADVHLTTDQAMESMRVALESITFIDDVALVRPHAYYRVGQGGTETASG